MVTRRRVRRRRVVRRGRGSGLWDLIKSGHNWLKNNKIISTVGNALAPVLPIAGTIGTAAGALGYGRRRRVRRRAAGGRRRRVVRRGRGDGWRDIAKAVNGFVRQNKLVSKGLSHFGHPKLASAASALGYGRRRVVRRGRGGAGYGTFFTTSQIAVPKF